MRRTRRSIRRAVGVVAVLGALAGCAAATTAPPASLRSEAVFVGEASASWTDERLSDASVRIASDLLALTPDDQDAVVSPLSAQLALALLREGATATVAHEIDAFAGLSDESRTVADLRAVLAVHEGDVAGIDRDDPPEVPLLHLADVAFFRPGDVGQDFLDDVARYHGADLVAVDFAAPSAKETLDAWVRAATGGLVEEAATEPDADTVAVLMNAAVLGASWAQPFRFPAADGPFTRADGTVVQVPLMTELVSARHATGDGWTAVELRYTDAFVMRLVLPATGGDVGAGTWGDVHAALERATERPVQVTLPRWETTVTLDLLAHLGTLGLTSLERPAGGLDEIFPGAYVDGFAQQATITVSENGTVAAAVTEIAVGESAAAMPDLMVRFDHPFEYQIVHTATGTVPFAGRVADPA